jgi:adenylate cyclase
VTNVTQPTRAVRPLAPGPVLGETGPVVSLAEPIADDDVARRPRDAARALAWAALLVLPLAGLGILLAAPATDVHWEQHPAHFWLVLSSALTSAVLAYATGDTARRRGDARLFVVALAFLAAAGFLGLHALATPGVLLEKRTAGFVLATPVGLLVAAGFAALSATRTVEARARAIVRRAGVLRAALIALMLVWAALSLARLGPLDDATPPESGSAPLTVLAVAGLALYGTAAYRYGALYVRLRAPILLAVVTAFALLAEAMIAVAFARNWHASWWEWHALMLTAFALIAGSAQRQAPEERFSDLYLDETSAGNRDVSVVFADLSGFTRFSDGRDPREVTAMLNASFERAIPAIRAHGGEIDRLVGDAIVATFNTRGDQPDHAQRAASAALDVLQATEPATDAHPDWPRFRIGINSGEAMVGVVGAREGKSYTVIGDTVNVAARLQGAAPVGAVAIGGGTLRGLPGARVRALGAVALKGKREPVEAYVLEQLDAP